MRTTAIAVALAALVGRAAASDLGADGQLSFASDAIATAGFESVADLVSSGGAWLRWTAANGTSTLETIPITAADDASVLVADALEGTSALRLQTGTNAGVGLRLDVFGAHVNDRVSVTFWGKSVGAEPVLELIYAHNTTNANPGLVHVIAIRTGRETSDGWAEYSTGPVDGAIFTAPLRVVVLTARYATDAGASTLVDSVFSPLETAPPQILDPTAYALADAVEVRVESGAATGVVACSAATVDTVCNGGECHFGHCVDSASVWGPLPLAADHRADVVTRWSFIAGSLLADRNATANAAPAFAAAADLTQATSPRLFYGRLHEIVANLRDSHTQLGNPPSSGSIVYPLASFDSGPLDVCFGIAANDLSAGEMVFAVFSVGPDAKTLRVGDVLTAIDGQAPMTWLAAHAPAAVANLPNDPSADPSLEARILASLIAHRATTIGVSRCQTGTGCTALTPITVAANLYPTVSLNGSYVSGNGFCTPRFMPSVSMPPDDNASTDVPSVETVAGITTVQLDGFAVAIPAPPNAVSNWETPISQAFVAGAQVVVDARMGHGGRFTFGEFLFHLVRGTDSPYGMFAMPRGDWDNPDPSWLFSSTWDSCNSSNTSYACRWTGGQTTFTNSVPAGDTTKIAWVNGDDVSMNDITPRLLQGRGNFRVFGPHPTRGAYGEIAYLPPIEPSWTRGSLQVLDIRFGDSRADARAARWESGHGVVPDEVVMQKVSDMLTGTDTMIAAARAWVSE